MSDEEVNSTAEPHDSNERFAEDLLALKDASGLSFSDLARRAGLGTTTVNDATLSHTKLASRRVVVALLRVLAPTREAEFVERRARLAGERSPAAVPAPEPFPSSGATSHPDTRGPRRRDALVVVAVMLCVSAAAFLAGRWSAPPEPIAGRDGTGPSPAGAPPSADALEGADAADTRCVDDAEVIARRAQANVGTLELLHSAACGTYWARAARADDGFGQRLDVTVQNLSDTSQAQTAVEYDVAGAYTFMIYPEAPAHRICATGVIYSGDRRRSLGPPLC